MSGQHHSSLLAVIPARGGSRRIPGKNIRTLLGKPMIAYTITAAIQSGLFQQIVVSTDSDEIADIATKHGASVPFLRDQSLADDYTPISAVTADVLDRLCAAGESFEAIAQLMANCPLRTAEDIQSSYTQFRKSGSHSQISVTRYGWQNPWWAMRMNDGFTLKPMFEQEATQRSQDLPSLFCPTGAVWWATTGTLQASRTYHIAGRTGWEMPWQHAVDIDTEEDWALAELLMKLSRTAGASHVP